MSAGLEGVAGQASRSKWFQAGRGFGMGLALRPRMVGSTSILSSQHPLAAIASRISSPLLLDFLNACMFIFFSSKNSTTTSGDSLRFWLALRLDIRDRDSHLWQTL